MLMHTLKMYKQRHKGKKKKNFTLTVSQSYTGALREYVLSAGCMRKQSLQGGIVFKLPLSGKSSH